MKYIRNSITALFLMLFIISLSVTIILNFRPIYYFDIHALHIPEYTGMSEEEIRLNYDALIDYNSIFNHEMLEFPTLPMSENGRIHFEEVKNIFVFFEYLCIITGIISLISICYLLIKKHEILFLKLTSIFTFLIPTALAIFVASNWERAFVLFHEIVFDNDYWIFYPDQDPVITILPDTFFMHCAIGIITLIFICILITLGLYLFLRHKNNVSYN